METTRNVDRGMDDWSIKAVVMIRTTPEAAEALCKVLLFGDPKAPKGQQLSVQQWLESTRQSRWCGLKWAKVVSDKYRAKPDMITRIAKSCQVVAGVWFNPLPNQKGLPKHLTDLLNYIVTRPGVIDPSVHVLSGRNGW
jgi:hypothetical protein